MKILVDEMPKEKRDCPFLEKMIVPGEAYCALDGMDCMRGIKCRWLKEVKHYEDDGR